MIHLPDRHPKLIKQKRHRPACGCADSLAVANRLPGARFGCNVEDVVGSFGGKIVTCIPYAALAFLLTTTLALGARAALPGNSEEGKRLHDANCTGCHDTRVYARKDRSVHSLDGLKQQLENCSHMAGKQFSVIEMQNLTKYLNDTFYQFR
jgi:hypothetical protein